MHDRIRAACCLEHAALHAHVFPDSPNTNSKSRTSSN